MQIELNCAAPLRRVITELLAARGLAVAAEANVVLLERGGELPEGKLAVVFESQQLDVLLEFCDALAQRTEQSRSGVVVGKDVQADRYEVIAYEEILYFTAEGSHSFCVTARSRLRVKERLYELEGALGARGFVRIGKALLVNIMMVAEIIPWFGARLLLRLKNGEELEVARNYAKGFKEFLDL